MNVLLSKSQLALISHLSLILFYTYPATYSHFLLLPAVLDSGVDNTKDKISLIAKILKEDMKLHSFSHGFEVRVCYNFF